MKRAAAPSPLQGLPGQPVVVRPALHHGDLVAVRQAVGEAAALHDGAAAAHLDGDAAVDVTDREFRGQRPDRDVAAQAEVLVAGDAVVHALAFAEQLVAGLDLTEAPNRLAVLAAGLIVDVRNGTAGPGAAADRL